MAPVLKADDTRAKRVQTQALAFDDMEQMAVFDENQRLYGAFTKFDTNHDGQMS
jgi:Ca2+-binding EF-hand superfamily protein